MRSAGAAVPTALASGCGVSSMASRYDRVADEKLCGVHATRAVARSMPTRTVVRMACRRSGGWRASSAADAYTPGRIGRSIGIMLIYLCEIARAILTNANVPLAHVAALRGSP